MQVALPIPAMSACSACLSERSRRICTPTYMHRHNMPANINVADLLAKKEDSAVGTCMANLRASSTSTKKIPYGLDPVSIFVYHRACLISQEEPITEFTEFSRQFPVYTTGSHCLRQFTMLNSNNSCLTKYTLQLRANRLSYLKQKAIGLRKTS
jgi:hypothetical protein